MQSTMTNTTPEVNEWPLIKVYGRDFRPMLKDMADTVDRLQLWKWFANEVVLDICFGGILILI